MVEPSVFDLARLLLPEPSGRLLVNGLHPELGRLTDDGWDIVVDTERGAADIQAVFSVGSSDPPAVANELPLGAIVSGKSALRHRKDFLVRDALPLTGRPLLWRAPGSKGRHSLVAAPRGRLDLLKLDLCWPLEPLRRFGYGWSIVADRHRSIIGRLLQMTELQHADWQQTRTGSLIAIGNEKVLKVPLRRVPVGHYARQNKQLDALRGTVNNPSTEKLFPANLKELQVGGQIASLERRLPGTSAFRVLGHRSKMQRIFKSATNFLQSWYGNDLEQRVVDDTLYLEHWESPLEPLAAALRNEGQDGLWQELSSAMRTRVIGRQLCLVPTHGDFWLNNLLVDELHFELTGVVDWDHASTRGLPLLDLFHMLTWRTRMLTADLSTRLLRRRLKDRSAFRVRLLSNHCAAVGLDPTWIPDLFCRYWAGQIAQRADEFFPGRGTLPGLKLITEFLAR